ncbi:DUF7093 family protein [Natrinema versiforme]|uniref:Uncharacterized protein n=1 Tax=Natrinema versiforme JCM 10478 TaxID=1227496 RepID=L9Y451_9EURY|nr:hypothetical protein [Natrinema versiforme]ELY68482.1 hypothetical protein C489_07265 [Natrinema versiforme JCM 10478]
MVLRCSLLGHDFGESEIEREREERGSEVVVTVQEYEECVRCGERSVISENTEVTSLTAGTDTRDSLPDEPETEPPEPPVDAPDDAAAGEPDADAGFTDADADDGIELSDGDDAEFIDADDTASDADETETPQPDPSPNAAEPEPTAADADVAAADATADADEIDLPTDENGEPVTDDGEILEDDEPSADRDRDRDHGEWPDSSDVGPPVGAESTPADWPDDPVETDSEAESAVEATDANPAEVDDDAILLDDDGPTSAVGAAGDDTTDGTAAAATDARSVTAEPPAADQVDADVDSDPDADSGTGIERAASAPTPAESGGAPAGDVPTEFYCPRCDYVAAGDRGSLRTGDICPDCRKGYLSERERQR